MEGLFELVADRILEGAVEVVDAYYGPISLSTARMLANGEREPSDEKEEAFVLLFRTLKHMFVLDYYIKAVEEGRYDEEGDNLELIRRELAGYITKLIDDIAKFQNTRLENKIEEVLEYLIHGILAYIKIKGDTRTLMNRIKPKLEEIKDTATKNEIISKLGLFDSGMPNK